MVNISIQKCSDHLEKKKKNLYKTDRTNPADLLYFLGQDSYRIVLFIFREFPKTIPLGHLGFSGLPGELQQSSSQGSFGEGWVNSLVHHSLFSPVLFLH